MLYEGLHYCPLFFRCSIQTHILHLRKRSLSMTSETLTSALAKWDALVWYIRLIPLANVPSFLSDTQENIRWCYCRNILVSLCATAPWSVIVASKTRLAMPVLNEESKLFWKVQWFPQSHIPPAGRPTTESPMSRLTFWWLFSLWERIRSHKAIHLKYYTCWLMWNLF